MPTASSPIRQARAAFVAVTLLVSCGGQSTSGTTASTPTVTSSPLLTTVFGRVIQHEALPGYEAEWVGGGSPGGWLVGPMTLTLESGQLLVLDARTFVDRICDDIPVEQEANPTPCWMIADVDANGRVRRVLILGYEEQDPYPDKIVFTYAAGLRIASDTLVVTDGGIELEVGDEVAVSCTGAQALADLRSLEIQPLNFQLVLDQEDGSLIAVNCVYLTG